MKKNKVELVRKEIRVLCLHILWMKNTKRYTRKNTGLEDRRLTAKPATQSKNEQTFPVKSQIINFFSFEGHIFSVASTQLYCLGTYLKLPETGAIFQLENK